MSQILGAVPPGARFDPFGPPDFASPMRGPRPRGGFGDPDYDHLQPPDYIWQIVFWFWVQWYLEYVC